MALNGLAARDRLIVALDVDDIAAAHKLIHTLRDVAGMFKVGSQLFTMAGPAIVKEIIASGARVFLDLKFHDIPHQVAGSVQSAARLGVSMLTIHASGGLEMMTRAVATASETAEAEGLSRPAIVAVSVLTSMDSTTLQQIGIAAPPAEAVMRLVNLAVTAKVDGVVASPQEASAIRSSAAPEFLIVTPGIRPFQMATDKVPGAKEDQRRVATPGLAIKAGADYLVVGRPVTKAPNPLEAAQSILAEIEDTESNQGEP
jgi:orotidine-5'-phosphate decarboxylase